MNRRQKIIVSITGIFIVLLALVGLTYAYFLTRITGNENDKSISVTTANLELVYADEDDEYVIGKNEIIEPGKTFESKTFTVTNNGNETVDEYAVILEGVSITYATTSGNMTEGTVTTLGSTTEGRDNDFTLVITCKNQDNETCNGYNAELLEESGILLTNRIEVGETQTYTATLTYNETGHNQSADMNKRYNGKFNIIDTKDTIDLKGLVANYSAGDYIQTNSTKRVSVIYPDKTYKIMGLEAGTHKIKVCAKSVTDCTDEKAKMIETIIIKKGDTASVDNTTKTITITDDSRLAKVDVDATNGTTINNEIENYNPFNEGTLANAMLSRAFNITKTESETTGYATFGNPDTTPVKSENLLTEAVLAKTDDNYGTSYYYRGNVKDNYVLFNNMCFRIIRIEGDGSAKLIYSGSVNEGVTTCDGLTEASAVIKHDLSYGEKQSYGKDDRLLRFADYESGELKQNLETWFESNFMSDGNLNAAGNKVKNDEWCLGGNYNYKYTINTGALINDIDLSEVDYNTFWYYEPGKRYYITKTTDLTCGETEDKISSQVGTITADEAILAGKILNSWEYTSTNYLDDNVGDSYSTLTKVSFGSNDDTGDFVAILIKFSDNSNNILTDGYVVNYNSQYGARPAITLIPGIKITKGTGIKGDPYIIDLNN